MYKPSNESIYPPTLIPKSIDDERVPCSLGLIDSVDEIVPCSLPSFDIGDKMGSAQAPVQQVEEQVPIDGHPKPATSPNIKAGDISDALRTSQVFSSREELQTWARAICIKHETVLVVVRYDGPSSGCNPRVILACERGGKFKLKKNSLSKSPGRKSGTKRCECPFQLKGVQVNVDGGVGWKLEILCGFHNHAPGQFKEGHSFIGRLNVEEVDIMKEMSEAGIKSSQILLSLKKKNPLNCSSIQTVYNARRKVRVDARDGRSYLQELMKCIEESGYDTYHKKDVETDTLTDIFFAHPLSVRLANIFPEVFVLDCTYKIYRYKLPVLCVIGMTSTSKNFFTCFAFLSSEKRSSYVWALERFRSLFQSTDLPSVLVTDRDQALLNAISMVFPTAKSLICVWHISNDILKNCRKLFGMSDIEAAESVAKGKLKEKVGKRVGKEAQEQSVQKVEDAWKKFMDRWTRLVYSESVDDYEALFKDFMHEYKDYPSALTYITNMWLGPHKENFVSA